MYSITDEIIFEGTYFLNLIKLVLAQITFMVELKNEISKCYMLKITFK